MSLVELEPIIGSALILRNYVSQYLKTSFDNQCPDGGQTLPLSASFNVPQMNFYSLLEILNLQFVNHTYLEDLNNVHMFIDL